MELIFLRHPRPADGLAGICYGRLDVAPGPGEGAEVVAAADVTPTCPAVRSSPARRCIGLARALARRDTVPLVFDERLRELDFGRWEGRPWHAVPRAESDPWAADPETVAPPCGETFADLRARVAAVLSEVVPGTVLVCHAGPIRAALMLLEGASFEQVFSRPVPYARPIAAGCPSA